MWRSLEYTGGIRLKIPAIDFAGKVNLVVKMNGTQPVKNTFHRWCFLKLREMLFKGCRRKKKIKKKRFLMMSSGGLCSPACLVWRLQIRWEPFPLAEWQQHSAARHGLMKRCYYGASWMSDLSSCGPDLHSRECKLRSHKLAYAKSQNQAIAVI